jgi:mannose-6-phosphate isomerase-like protein (cupin superfamily)
MQISVDKALNLLDKADGQLFVKVMEHGTISVELYRPEKVDLQTPHKQDELYVVINGSGDFLNNGKRTSFKPGDVLFVPAGVEHRFENFTDDFSAWVIFYGSEGGEK